MVLSCMIVNVQDATADLLCAKVKMKRNGRLSLKQRTVTEDSCPRGFTKLIDTEILKGDQGTQGTQGPQGDQGESGSADIACYASFTTSGSPTVRKFGGEVVTSVEATRNGAGDYTLKCNGDFSGFDDLFDIATVSSLQATTVPLGIVAAVTAANLSEEGHFTVNARVFNTTTGAASDTGTIVIVLIGKPSGA